MLVLLLMVSVNAPPRSCTPGPENGTVIREPIVGRLCV